jgi:hypothetical protein
MFRVTLGLATAMFFGLAAASPASAGCCGSSWGGWGGGWGVNTWGGGCCNTGYVYAQPAPIVVQAPVQPIVVAAPPPVFVQAPPQQVIVQQSQPEVIFQQAAVAPVVQSYRVDQGPYYAGPEAIGYPQTQYNVDVPTRPYPYVSGGYYKPRYWGRPYVRGWRYGYRGPRVYANRYGYGHPVARNVARGAYVKRHWN